MSSARRRALGFSFQALLLCATGWHGAAQADGVSALRDFVQNVQSGRATFNQTVTSPDGA